MMKSRRVFLGRTLHLSFVSLLSSGCRKDKTVVPGIEVLLTEQTELIRGKRVGLVTNHTGVDRQLRHNIDLLKSVPEVNLVAVFTPEHGLSGRVQAGQKVNNNLENRWGIPIFSLYSNTILPTAKMLQDVEVLIYDIQDVGSRYYTYLSTLMNCLKEAGRHNIPFIVLDRPNPLGGLIIEGRTLDLRLRSLVGPAIIPVRYGLTPGELAHWLKAEMHLKTNLTVVRMNHWKRQYWYNDTGLIWIPPSPNIPTLKTALIYVGMCLLEGTNVSEGRGTTTPFEVAAAPWIDGRKLAQSMESFRLPGVTFRNTSFTPSFSKFSGQICQGVQLHVTNRNQFEPIKTALCLIGHLRFNYSSYFKWAENHFDRLAGAKEVRYCIEQGEPVESMLTRWHQKLGEFEIARREFFLYS